MVSKENVKILRAELRLKYLADFKTSPNVEVTNIPSTRTLFEGTDNDYWQEIKNEYNENKTSCLYEMDGKSYFPTHKHEAGNEICTLLTPGAKVEWVTEKGIFEYEYPASFEVPKNMKHALVNLVDFPIKIHVDWYPRMEGWNAIFKTNK